MFVILDFTLMLVKLSIAVLNATSTIYRRNYDDTLDREKK